MSKRAKLSLLLVALILVGVAAAVRLLLSHGFSTRDEPTALEAFVARRLRHLAIPREVREAKNPMPLTPEVLREAMEHFADHCALCHGNDGRGLSEIGQNLYPKAPDMWLDETQRLSDGELFYIVKNGVRLTGMPAWGANTPEDDLDSWKLVHFIRRLPQITPEELEEMKALNPVSRRQLEEEEEVRRFLEGEPEASEPSKHKH